jgi:hypothetical protein
MSFETDGRLVSCSIPQKAAFRIVQRNLTQIRKVALCQASANRLVQRGSQCSTQICLCHILSLSVGQWPSLKFRPPNS